MRQGNLELPRYTGVFPLLGKLGRIPQVRPIPRPIGGYAHGAGTRLGQDDLRMFHALLGRVVVRDAIALVGQLLTGTISHRGDGAAADRSRNWLHAQMVDRQATSSDAVLALPASLQASGALSYAVTRKCALLNSIASLFRRSVRRLRQGRRNELKAGLCCKTDEFTRETAKQLEIAFGNDSLGCNRKGDAAWRARRSNKGWLSLMLSAPA
ncbi:hypothetical protein MESS2_p190002 [Mesorhizobium metallidurans STM 2683]|uniref:Uncharacterized protein n=1 Tax=Mesorhizobium metallidurans STM 2683 TaxID=1297569 RepID=M5EWR0_9HYPH|nr:hypothetical protein MESS2_p190002 [Mesorhizobium metallidurans STM 2683]